MSRLTYFGYMTKLPSLKSRETRKAVKYGIAERYTCLPTSGRGLPAIRRRMEQERFVPQVLLYGPMRESLDTSRGFHLYVITKLLATRKRFGIRLQVRKGTQCPCNSLAFTETNVFCVKYENVPTLTKCGWCGRNVTVALQANGSERSSTVSK